LRPECLESVHGAAVSLQTDNLAIRTSDRSAERINTLILADEELREVAPERSTDIEIQEFVNEAEISRLYFEKPYYLEPDKGAGKAYALLREALLQTGKIGIAQFALRNRTRDQTARATIVRSQFARTLRSSDGYTNSFRNGSIAAM
jgi:Ku protein